MVTMMAADDEGNERENADVPLLAVAAPLAPCPVGFTADLFGDAAPSPQPERICHSFIRGAKTGPNEEHVDALARFLAAVAPTVPIKTPLLAVLALPRADCPSLSMKSRFKLEDAAKASR